MMSEVNAMEYMQNKRGGSKSGSRGGGLGRFVVFIVFPLIIVIVGVAATMHLMRTSPKAVPREKPVYETLVQVEQIKLSSHQTTINAMGNTVSAQKVDLKSRVGGDVVYLNDEMVPGGVLTQGQTVLKIDPADYELRVEQLQSEVAKAEANLALEMGNQRVAQMEFELLGEEAAEEERVLMLRVPQLKQMEASLKSSVSKLNEAKLDLKRTELKAPFDSVIKSKSVELGARVSESSPVAHLIGTDTFWVQVSVPVEKLSWINFPNKTDPDSGSSVKIFPGARSSDFRTGKVIKLAADLEENGRMAKIIIDVNDPLCLEVENQGQPLLFLGSYVKVEIAGKELNQVYSLDRSNLRDGNTIWLLEDDLTLEIRPVEPIFKGSTHVLLEGDVKPGEKLVVSNIATPVSGMKVRPEGMRGAGQGKGGKKGMGKPPGMVSPDGAAPMKSGQGAPQEGAANVQ